MAATAAVAAQRSVPPQVPLPRPRPALLAPAVSETSSQPSACQSELGQRAVFVPLPPLVGPGNCGAPEVVRLDAACRSQQLNDGCFERIEDVPTHAYTLTIPALMRAPVVSVVVPGPRKANAVLTTLRGPIS